MNLTPINRLLNQWARSIEGQTIARWLADETDRTAHESIYNRSKDQSNQQERQIDGAAGGVDQTCQTSNRTLRPVAHRSLPIVHRPSPIAHRVNHIQLKTRQQQHCTHSRSNKEETVIIASARRRLYYCCWWGSNNHGSTHQMKQLTWRRDGFEVGWWRNVKLMWCQKINSRHI